MGFRYMQVRIKHSLLDGIAFLTNLRKLMGGWRWKGRLGIDNIPPAQFPRIVRMTAKRKQQLAPFAAHRKAVGR
jgi:hypothetical protein